MAHTVFMRSAMRKPNPPLVSLSNSVQIESIMGSGRNRNVVFSPTIKAKIAEAKRHFEKLGTPEVYLHSFAVLMAAAEGKLFNPMADERDSFSMELVDQILYHSLDSDSHLPTNVRFSSRFLDTFSLQRTCKALDSMEGERMAAYIRLLNDASVDQTNLLIALYTRMADMMTVHDPATVKVASSVKLPGVFPVRGDWKRVQQRWAEPMLYVYCKYADWGGHTHAYRELRKNAMRYLYPRQYRLVAEQMRNRTEALRTTGRFMFGALHGMATTLKKRVLVAPNDKAVSLLFPYLGPDTMAVALGDFKDEGGQLAKALKRAENPNDPEEITRLVEENHDWARFTVITHDEGLMYDSFDYFVSGGASRAARELGVSDLRMDDVQDFVGTNKKPVTGYESLHADAISDDPRVVNTEAKFRTKGMHENADEGKAAHDQYKDEDRRFPLENGERTRFKQVHAQIAAAN